MLLVCNYTADDIVRHPTNILHFINDQDIDIKSRYVTKQCTVLDINP